MPFEPWLRVLDVKIDISNAPDDEHIAVASPRLEPLLPTVNSRLVHNDDALPTEHLPRLISKSSTNSAS